MRKMNYEIAVENAQKIFLEYDQEKIIEKFHVKHDDSYLYIGFVKREYRIGRKNGLVERFQYGTTGWEKAGFNEAMSIFDVLCWSKDNCCLSGKFCKINNLKGTVKSAFLGENLYQDYADKFDLNLDKFMMACDRLGGRKANIGDISYYLDIFDFLPVILQFWKSDEEFPASLKMMWDENILDFVHYETSYYILNHVFDRICEEGGFD